MLNESISSTLHWSGSHLSFSNLLQKSDLPQPSMSPVLSEPQQAMSRLSALCFQVSGKEPTQVQVWCQHPHRGRQCYYWGACTPTAFARCALGGLCYLRVCPAFLTGQDLDLDFIVLCIFCSYPCWMVKNMDLCMRLVKTLPHASCFSLQR